MASNNVTPILDLLTVNNFYVEVERLPIIRYWVQNVTLPDLTLPEVRRPSPFQNIMEVGDHCEFGPLTFDFLVDEELVNWQAMFYWMNGLGFPEKFGQFADFVAGVYKKHGIKEKENLGHSGAFQFSDVTLTITSNHKTPLMTMTFKDCFPTNLGAIAMSVSDADSSPITASVTLQFTGMELRVKGA